MSIRKRARGAYQVRVSPFPAQTVPTREAAEALQLDFKLRRSLGDLYEEPAETLAQAIDGHIERKLIYGGRRGALRPKSIEYLNRSVKVWRDDTSLGRTLLPQLRRSPIEDIVLRRARVYPRSARNELQALKAVLVEARARGQRVDVSILDIPPVKHDPRRGRALTVNELYELTSWFPEHVKRLVLLAGQVGARQHVWLSMTDDMLDLDAGTMAIAAELAKNRREHSIYLTPLEVTLFREQLVARAPGTRLVFPTKSGRRWMRNHFRKWAWVPAVTAAAAHDRDENGRASSVYGAIDKDGTLVNGFTFHMLRHTAGSLMALAGMDAASASERLGHTDGGALFLRTYRHLYEGEKRKQAMKLERLVERERRRATASR